MVKQVCHLCLVFDGEPLRAIMTSPASSAIFLSILSRPSCQVIGVGTFLHSFCEDDVNTSVDPWACCAAMHASGPPLCRHAVRPASMGPHITSASGIFRVGIPPGLPLSAVSCS